MAIFELLIIDSWDTCSVKSINSGTILSFDAVCVDSPIITMLQKSKQTLGILSSIRDHRKKSKKTRKVTYTCSYTSGHLGLLFLLTYYCVKDYL